MCGVSLARYDGFVCPTLFASTEILISESCTTIQLVWLIIYGLFLTELIRWKWGVV